MITLNKDNASFFADETYTIDVSNLEKGVPSSITKEVFAGKLIKDAGFTFAGEMIFFSDKKNILIPYENETILSVGNTKIFGGNGITFDNYENNQDEGDYRLEQATFYVKKDAGSEGNDTRYTIGIERVSNAGANYINIVMQKAKHINYVSSTGDIETIIFLHQAKTNEKIFEIEINVYINENSLQINIGESAVLYREEEGEYVPKYKGKTILLNYETEKYGFQITEG